MNDNNTNTTENKWKNRFFLLLGVVLGQLLGRLLFSFTGSATPTVYAALTALWLTILAWGCWANFRKRKFLLAIFLGLNFVLFLAAFFYLQHVGFGWMKPGTL